jgi:uncharacterized RDD family membrane protein YckC
MGKLKDKLPQSRHFHAHETARFDALSGLPLATFKQRAWAIAIDFLIVAALRTMFHMHGHESDEEGCSTIVKILLSGVNHIVEVIESFVYFGVLVKLMNGYTPGKKMMKCRVVSLVHDDMSWWHSIERALGYGASLLEGGFGFAQFFLTRNRQCVHDRIAETIVIDERPTAKRLTNEDTEKVDAPLG